MHDPTTVVPRAFVNYRREDTQGLAAALASALHRLLEGGEVFLDHRDIKPGEAWPDRLRDEIRRSTIVLVLIGRRWLTLADDDGIRRLDDPDDWVRAEIEEALAGGKTIVQILLDGAEPPRRDAFRTIKSIEPLAALQALELSAKAWDEGIEKICALLEQHGFRRASSRHARPLPDRPARSTIPQRGTAPFHGRDTLLAQIARLVEGQGTALIVLHGQPGVGKSELAREFARRNEARYPGGRFVVDMRASGPPVDLARVGRTILALTFAPGLPLEDQCLQTLLSLGGECLLIYDNARSPRDVESWLPPAGVSAHVLVTSVQEDWDGRWTAILVPPLTDDDAHLIVEELGGSMLTREAAHRLVEQAAGLPVQLVPATLSARKALARGASATAVAELANEARASFERPWSILDSDPRVLLSACTFFHPERISRRTLERLLAEAAQWPEGRTDAAVNAAMDLRLLEGRDPLRMHQLWSRFVREKGRELGRPEIGALAQVLARTLVETSTRVGSNPGSAECTLALLSFALEVDVWSSTGLVAGECHALGLALVQIGRFDEALPWLQRAAELASQPAADGRVDHTQVGQSLHEAGYCYSRRARYQEAQEWFERALAALERGGPDGAVNHTARARSLHQIGICLSRQRRYEEARGWYERAAEAAGHAGSGKVDNETVGASLHQVGYCLMKLQRLDEALDWFERAVAAAELGDEYGRVDHESVGQTLDQIAHSLSLAKRNDEAVEIYQRAVTVKEKGDVHGRVDYVSVGRSLHQVGYDLSLRGQHAEALTWYERAAAISEKGDVYGRVDLEGIGRSLHQIGSSLKQLGRRDEAREWYERALAAKQAGDLFGRVDDESVELTRQAIGGLATAGQ